MAQYAQQRDPHGLEVGDVDYGKSGGVYGLR
jgi:hypothetical protein